MGVNHPSLFTDGANYTDGGTSVVLELKGHPRPLPHPGGALPHMEGGLIYIYDLQARVIHHSPDNLLTEFLLLVTDLPLSVLLAIEDDLWPLERDPQSPVIVIDCLMSQRSQLPFLSQYSCPLMEAQVPHLL